MTTARPSQADLIGGRYRLERELARGGMGSVWVAVDQKLRRSVAVKLVTPDWGGASDAQQRFEREAMAVAKMQSPHVVQIFDYGVERGCPYIVMELLEGEDLRSRLHKVKRVSLETAAHILVQCAKALSAAHAAGVIHRDLKPGNLFLVRAGEEEIVKVLDFGVATTMEELADDGEDTIMGTPQFMSPEQARGLPDLDHRTDLWSLGVIIYRALSGRMPFKGKDPTELVLNICTHEPPALSQLAPDLPAELDGFFQRAFAPEPSLRFSSARQMALAFSRISPVTFTTLSMPNPGPALEAAIRRAKDKTRGNAGSDPGVAPDSQRTPPGNTPDGSAAAPGPLAFDEAHTTVHVPPPSLKHLKSRRSQPKLQLVDLNDDEHNADSEPASEPAAVAAADDQATVALSRSSSPSIPLSRSSIERLEALVASGVGSSNGDGSNGDEASDGEALQACTPLAEDSDALALGSGPPLVSGPTTLEGAVSHPHDEGGGGGLRRTVGLALAASAAGVIIALAMSASSGTTPASLGRSGGPTIALEQPAPPSPGALDDDATTADPLAPEAGAEPPKAGGREAHPPRTHAPRPRAKPPSPAPDPGTPEPKPTSAPVAQPTPPRAPPPKPKPNDDPFAERL